jgi:hypothetical protein
MNTTCTCVAVERAQPQRPERNAYTNMDGTHLEGDDTAGWKGCWSLYVPVMHVVRHLIPPVQAVPVNAAGHAPQDTPTAAFQVCQSVHASLMVSSSDKGRSLPRTVWGMCRYMWWYAQ